MPSLAIFAVSKYLYATLVLNYLEIPDSCLISYFAFRVHVSDVLVYHPRLHPEQFTYLRLSQPDGLVFKSDRNFGRFLYGLIEQDAANHCPSATSAL